MTKFGPRPTFANHANKKSAREYSCTGAILNRCYKLKVLWCNTESDNGLYMKGRCK